jgi:hypothetical protein
MDPTATPTCGIIGLPVKFPLMSEEVIIPVVDIPLFEANTLEYQNKKKKKKKVHSELMVLHEYVLPLFQ